MPIPIMAHLVLGYPTLNESIRSAETYLAAGVAILELQIPFSHPTADGPVITAACRAAVEQGVTVADCLAAVSRLREKYPEQEIMLMSYVNRIYAFGMEKFADHLKALNIRHIIVPDLPVTDNFDSPRRHGGTERYLQDDNSLCLRVSVVNHFEPTAPGAPTPRLVPVLAANVSNSRLDQLIGAGYDFFYLMSGFKITGSTFSLHPGLKEIVARIRAGATQTRIGIGFGIGTADQVQAVLEVADYAIVGSALIRAQEEGRLDDYLKQLKNTVQHTTLIP